MSVLSLNGVTPPAFHPVALALIVLAAVLLWRRAFLAKN
jgi:MYXO-CTERM domain-containing protein